MNKMQRAIITAVIFGFLGLLFTPIGAGSFWLLIAIFVFYIEWRFGPEKQVIVPKDEFRKPLIK